MSEHEHKQPAGSYPSNRTGLAIALAITAAMMIVEFAGGLLSGSLALVSDAGHMLTDTGALSLALFALWYSKKPATREKTYGFYRTEILSALINGVVLTLIAVYIFFEAAQRFINPTEVKGLLMLSVASIGLVANLAGAFVLSKGSRENLNVKGALLHVISDAVSSVGVIIGGLIIIFTGFYLIDPILGFIIGIIILKGAWGLIRESVDILLEATPKDIKIIEVEKALKAIEGIKGVHDIHIWTITSGVRAFSAHILINDAPLSECAVISKNAKNVLKEKFNISHAVIETESCKA